MVRPFETLSDDRALQLQEVMYAMLRRRDWYAASRALRALIPNLRAMPIDAFKGMATLAARHPDEQAKVARLYRKLLSIKLLRKGTVQTDLFHETVSFELALLLWAVQAQRPAPRSGKANPDPEAMLRGGVAFLQSALKLMPDCHAFLHYLVKARNALRESPLDDIDRFVADSPDNPAGWSILRDHLAEFCPTDTERRLRAALALLRIDPMSNALDDVVSVFREGRLVPPEQLFQLCTERLAYSRCDLLAWRIASELLVNYPGLPKPDEWWLDMHFRHPKRQALSLGLIADDRADIDRVPVQEDTIDMVAHKVVCAGHLLPGGFSSRFVVETVRALQCGGFITVLNRLSATSGRSDVPRILFDVAAGRT
ncbi:hypothetical protein PBRA_006144 [Plasmodiophora brassicae]|uniref:Uncharacterized protein n=1 Tax=Plasmodiophora brassicae TaxID=37360 RepID=A0A0G4IS02_PLABS|nr:hypothetical protein PBRA_006144 [Plasmodiophora brassicae]